MKKISWIKFSVLEQFVVTIVFLMLTFGIQLKYFASPGINQIWDRIIFLFILFLIITRGRNDLTIIYVACFLITILLWNFKQGLYEVFVFYFGCLIPSKNNRIFNTVILIVVLNILIMSYQISGISSLAYLYQNYNGDTDVLNSVFNFKNQLGVPLMQLRPSGIFPSTVYLSLFEFFLVAYFFKQKNLSKVHFGILALMLAISGSTAALLLVFIAFILKNDSDSKFLLVSYSVFVFLYWLSLPSIFFEYNYSLADLLSSVCGRLSNSYLHQYSYLNTLLLVLATLLATILIINKERLLDIKAFAFVGLLFLAPLLIHNFLTVTFYWFYAGYLYKSCITKNFNQVYL